MATVNESSEPEKSENLFCTAHVTCYCYVNPY